MANSPTVDEIMELARRLSPDQKLKLIEKLAAEPGSKAAPQVALDDQYQRGYEQVPERPVTWNRCSRICRWVRSNEV